MEEHGQLFTTGLPSYVTVIVSPINWYGILCKQNPGSGSPHTIGRQIWLYFDCIDTMIMDRGHLERTNGMWRFPLFVHHYDCSTSYLRTMGSWSLNRYISFETCGHTKQISILIQSQVIPHKDELLSSKNLRLSHSRSIETNYNIIFGLKSWSNVTWIYGPHPYPHGSSRTSLFIFIFISNLSFHFLFIKVWKWKWKWKVRFALILISYQWYILHTPSSRWGYVM